MADISATLRVGLEARGWKVHALETAALSARFTVTDPVTGQDCEVDILKEIFWRPVAQSPYGPVLAEEDVIGTKVRALADREAPRDLIDVFAASRRWSNAELEEFGHRHARGRFEREDLQANLTGAEWTDDEAFAAYGLDDATITALRTWAVEWADDLATRLLEEPGDPDIDRSCRTCTPSHKHGSMRRAPHGHARRTRRPRGRARQAHPLCSRTRAA